MALLLPQDVTGEALSSLVLNKMRGVLDVCAIKSPGFGNRRAGYLEDIATLTGGTFVTEQLGLSLETVTPEARSARTASRPRARRHAARTDAPTPPAPRADTTCALARLHPRAPTRGTCQTAQCPLSLPRLWRACTDAWHRGARRRL